MNYTRGEVGNLISIKFLRIRQTCPHAIKKVQRARKRFRTKMPKVKTE